MKKISLTRYERHIDIPEIGVEGQEKLAAASVLIVGAGGLGCPAALYLAAAGIGRIGLADADTVSLTNLQRQVLYAEEDVGQPKVEKAAARLLEIASHLTVDAYPFFITAENAEAVISKYDVVLDCTDNFDTRYLLNKFCFRLKKKLVSASVYHYDGQISVFKAHEGGDNPCYQCLYPDSEKLELAPSCKEGGILGPVAGLFGTLQALAAVNELLGLGESLSGHMWMFNSFLFNAEKIRIFRKENCEICSGQESDTFRKTECTIS